MSIFARLRAFHTVLGALTLAAYLSEDWNSLHIWLGYGVGLIITLRILSLPASRFLPRPAWLFQQQDNQPSQGLRNPIISKAFIVAIMVSLSFTVMTGLLLDESRPNIETASFIASTYADNDSGKKKQKPNKMIKGVHEFSANTMLAFVGLHVAYLLIFRRKYALRMIFTEMQPSKKL